MRRIENPPNPFITHDREYLAGMEPSTSIEVYEDQTRQILAKNDSPDVGFKWSLNPYRGCVHACAYCYARPTHEYLGFGAGTDFETKIIVKTKAPEILRETFMKRSWKGEVIAFSGDTDCYQPLEAHYQLTRRCLEVCEEFGNPLGIITKSYLITRDIDLLKKLDQRTRLTVIISIPFFDEKIGRIIEPFAASVRKRFETLQILSRNGIDVGVNIAPIIPGLNDADIPKILKEAKFCGAKFAGHTLLRLPGSVKSVFLSRLSTNLPGNYQKIVNRIRETREGNLTNSKFGERMRGTGDYWQTIEKMFNLYCEKFGLNQKQPSKKRPPFQRPTLQKELAL